MELDPPSIHLKAAADYHADQQALYQDMSNSVSKKYTCSWKQWRRFYCYMHVAPDLQEIMDPLPFLQTFAERVGTGVLSRGVNPIRKCLVEQYLRSIGQSCASVGANNPRHNSMGKLNFHLDLQITSHQKEYPPPTSVLTLSVHVVHDLDITLTPGTPRQQAIYDIICITLFFLLHPGAYCKGGTDTNQQPF